MFSLIICSRNQDITSELKKNISDTIGVNFELIIIDNSTNQYSIAEAYNIGIKRSKHAFLCFLHDDILFHTQNWGGKALNYLNNPSVGVVGVAGSQYVTTIPGGWWSSKISTCNIIQNIEGKSYEHLWRYKNSNSKTEDVILIDGLWICVRKELFQIIRFDEENFSEFHFYDSDICMQIIQEGFKALVVFDISIEHFSFGNSNKSWTLDSFKFIKKWRKLLPIGCIPLSNIEKKRAYLYNYKDTLRRISDGNQGFYVKLQFLKNILFLRRNFIYYCSPNFIIKEYFRAIIKKCYPEINFDNSLWNSFKYIVKNAFTER